MTHPPQPPRRIHPANAWILLTALLLLSIILLNCLIQLIPSRFTMFDLTAQKISEISDFTKEYLAKLDEDVVVYRLCNAGNENKALDQLLSHYDQLSGHIAVEAIDPTVRPQLAAQYTDKTLSDNSLIIVGDKRSKALDYNDLLLYNIYYSSDGTNYSLQSQMTYSDFMNFYDTYADSFSMGLYTYETLFVGEDAITSAIDYVTTDVLPTVYVTTGHGESALPDSLYAYLSNDNIECADYGILKNGVPEDASALLINAPVEDFTEEEITALRDYLLIGGNLLLLTAPSSLELANLRTLLKDFGMDAKENLIAESDQNDYHYYKYFLAPDTQGARDFYGLSSYTLLAPNCHPILMVQGTHQVTYTSLFSTSDKAYLEPLEASEADEEDESDEEDSSSSTDSADTKGRYDVGALVTVSGEKAGHICWLASYEILENDWNTSSGGGNFTYFLTILENMCEKNYSLTIASKVLDSDVLVLSNLQVGFWGVILIAVIPASVMGIGIAILLKRKYR